MFKIVNKVDRKIVLSWCLKLFIKLTEKIYQVDVEKVVNKIDPKFALSWCLKLLIKLIENCWFYQTQ